MIPKEIVRSYGGYDADAVSNATGLECKDASRTVQDQARDADINTIVRNFGVTGKVPANIRAPMEGDFTEVGDYRSCLDAIRATDEAFAAMPSDLRSRLDNDPARFVDYCADPANVDEMKKYGLAVSTAVVPAAPTRVEIVNPPQEAGATAGS